MKGYLRRILKNKDHEITKERGFKMLKEFKQFALKGNMIELAVGIIIGGAFNSIVRSLVDDIVMPFLSIFTKDINFSDLFIALNGEHYETLALAKDDGAATINYGLFLSGVLNFLIMAFVVFLLVKWLNKFKKPDIASEPTTKKCPHCISEINVNATKCPHCTADITE
jgi:large conductance mechanosensitive channel